MTKLTLFFTMILSCSAYGAKECPAPSGFPKSSTYVKVLITSKDGSKKEVKLNPMLQKTEQSRFGDQEIIQVNQADETVALIKLAM